MRWGGAGSTRGRIGWLSLLILGLALGLTASTAAAATGWSGGSAVDPLENASSMSCPTSTFCAALVGTPNGGAASTFNGHAWTALSTLSGGGSATSVSCSSASFCMAVGGTDGWIYDGHTWSSAPAGLSYATGVSCVSNSFCVVVSSQGFAYVYNGSSWGPIYTVASGFPYLRQVSCVSTSFCVAIDWTRDAYVFNGTSWITDAAIGSAAANFASIACASPSFCQAVDDHGNVTSYNGTTWSSPAAVDPGAKLVSISCPETTFCLAADDQGSYILYDGTSWGAPAVGDPAGGGFAAVACSSASACILSDAAGALLTYSGGSDLNVSTVFGGGGLTSVSCPAITFCTAVDWNGRALNYDGTSWSAPAAIEPVGLGLSGVSCASSAFCAAVDAAGEVISYNGSAWSSGSEIDQNGGLDSISCPSASFCVAVDQRGSAFVMTNGTWGSGTDVDGSQPLVSVSCPTTAFCVAVDAAGNALTWRSGVWSAPTPIDPADGFADVSCSSASACAAVGGLTAWTYNGSTWSPTGGSTFPSFLTVSCASANFCTAMDDRGEATAFDGNTWSDPARVDYWQDPTSISCASAGACAEVDAQGWAYTYSATVPSPPVTTGSPAITGTAAEGQALSVVDPAWTNSPTSTAYQWEDCDTNGANCVAIAGANASSYVASSADIGDTLRVVEWAFNTGGTGGPVQSPPTATVVPAGPPSNTSRPTITGLTTAGQMLTATPGTWSESPLSFGYQWLSCTSVSNCTAIAGATTSTYRLSASDVGHTVEVDVRATNAIGSTTVASRPTISIAAAPAAPVDASPPILSGEPVVGMTLQAVPGRWTVPGATVSPPFTYAYQWQRCSGTCVDVAGATGATYRLRPADVAALVRVVVTATYTGIIVIRGGTSYPLGGTGQDVSGQVGPVSPSLTVIDAALRGVLTPRGHAARVRSLLKARRFAVRFFAPTPGRLTITWYSAGGRHRKPVLMARALVEYHSSRPARVWVILTRAGRRALSAARRPVRLLATASFLPFDHSAGSDLLQRAFTLRP